MNKSIKLMLILFLMSNPAFSATWTNWHTLTGNFFYDTVNGPMIAITTENDFHTCNQSGSNNWANIKSSTVDLDSFKMINATILSTWLSEKQVSLFVDGCDGTRAKVIGVRISQ